MSSTHYAVFLLVRNATAYSVKSSVKAYSNRLHFLMWTAADRCISADSHWNFISIQDAVDYDTQFNSLWLCPPFKFAKFQCRGLQSSVLKKSMMKSSLSNVTEYVFSSIECRHSILLLCTCTYDFS